MVAGGGYGAFGVVAVVVDVVVVVVVILMATIVVVTVGVATVVLMAEVAVMEGGAACGCVHTGYGFIGGFDFSHGNKFQTRILILISFIFVICFKTSAFISS